MDSIVSNTSTAPFRLHLGSPQLNTNYFSELTKLKFLPGTKMNAPQSASELFKLLGDDLPVEFRTEQLVKGRMLNNISDKITIISSDGPPKLFVKGDPSVHVEFFCTPEESGCPPIAGFQVTRHSLVLPATDMIEATSREQLDPTNSLLVTHYPEINGQRKRVVLIPLAELHVPYNPYRHVAVLRPPEWACSNRVYLTQDFKYLVVRINSNPPTMIVIDENKNVFLLDNEIDLGTDKK